MKKNIIFLAMAGFAGAVSAQETDTLRLDELVVTGSRFEESIRSTGKSLYRIDREQINSLNAISIGEILEQVPGLFINGWSGTPGTNLSYNSRGMGSEHTAILIDGVPISDPSFASPFVDLRLFSPDMIESVEISQGGLNTLYGSGASAGVINLRTRKPTKEGLSGTVRSGAGSFGTYQGSISLGQSYNKGSFTAFGSYGRSRGFSAALDETSSSNFDEDGMESYSFQAFAERRIGKSIELKGNYFHSWFWNEYDGGPFFDASESSDNRMDRLSLSPSFSQGNLEVVADLAYLVSDRNYFGSFPGNFKGREAYSDLYAKWKKEGISLLGGVNHRRPSVEDENLNFSQTLTPFTDLYLNTELERGAAKVHMGGRAHFHSMYGTNLVYLFNPSYKLRWNKTMISVYGQASSAFVAPSPTQLYAFWGNEELRPETSRLLELGSNINWKNLGFRLTGFYRNVTDKILYVWTGESGNLVNIDGNRDFSGIESMVEWSVRAINITASYSLMRNDDLLETDNFTPVTQRIPSTMVKGMITWKALEFLHLNTQYEYISSRNDISYSNFPEVNIITLEDYHILNAGISVKRGKWRGDFSVKNLLNQEYMQILGYGTAGRNWNAGLTFVF